MILKNAESEICNFLDTVPNLLYQTVLNQNTHFNIVGTFPGGRSFYIKIKMPGETISAREHEFIAFALSIGAIAFVARSVIDVYKVFYTGGIVSQ